MRLLLGKGLSYDAATLRPFTPQTNGWEHSIGSLSSLLSGSKPGCGILLYKYTKGYNKSTILLKNLSQSTAVRYATTLLIFGGKLGKVTNDIFSYYGNSEYRSRISDAINILDVAHDLKNKLINTLHY